MAEHSNYFFLPHVGIEQQPSAPFTWKDNYEKQCTAAADKCLGFDSGGNVFDAKIMAPGGAKLSYHESPNYGSFLKDEAAFKSMCQMASGTPTGRRCNTTAKNVENAITGLVKRGAVETFDPRFRHGLMRARARLRHGFMEARRTAQQLHLFKTVLVFAFLVWLVYTVKKLK